MNSDAAAVVIQTTTDNAESAQRIAAAVVEARLAACAQVIGPIASTYRWQERLETATEHLLQLKTTTDRAEAALAVVRRLHDYEEPELIVLPIVGGSPGYLRWLADATNELS